MPLISHLSCSVHACWSDSICMTTRIKKRNPFGMTTSWSSHRIKIELMSVSISCLAYIRETSRNGTAAMMITTATKLPWSHHVPGGQNVHGTTVWKKNHILSGYELLKAMLYIRNTTRTFFKEGGNEENEAYGRERVYFKHGSTSLHYTQSTHVATYLCFSFYHCNKIHFRYLKSPSRGRCDETLKHFSSSISIFFHLKRKEKDIEHDN